MTSSRNGRRILRYLAAVLLVAAKPANASRLSEALDLEAKGRLAQSRNLLRAAIEESRGSGDPAALARAFSALARVSVSLGDYRGAIQSADEAVAIQKRLQRDTALSEDYNTLGLASLYLGNYDAALANYQKALDLDEKHGNLEAEIVRENNIGNVFYFRGQYQDALRAYQQAMDKLAGSEAQPWAAKRRQLTVANLAALYQRLGNEQTALELYGQITGTPRTLSQAEYAQLLVNEGVLYRRLGDPLKALERYQSAQELFAAERHRDAEIRTLQNIGIVRALELSDLEGARVAFTAALGLAQQSSDGHGIAQATLYRGEVLRRQGKLAEAATDLRTALAGAEKAGLAEERWKALYGLGKLAESEHDPARAADYYSQAITGIESVRGGMRRAALRSEFLADKRDVYDALITICLRQSDPPLDRIFGLMEQSRARTLEERSPVEAKLPRIGDIRAMLPENAVFTEFWVGDRGFAELWITRSGAGLVHHPGAQGRLADLVLKFDRSLQGGSGDWKRLSHDLGKEILAGVPVRSHILAAPDGPITALPLETLTAPASGRLVIEGSDVAYLPAARFLGIRSAARLLPPWRTQLLAFGDPPVSGAGPLGENEQWQPIAAAKDEIESIARLLPGRSELHLGSAARKRDLLSRKIEGIPLLHFSTHAVVDADNPDRSRIVMAADSPNGGIDYLFQQEVYGLDLKGVDLATISACESARGKIVGGDGTQAFHQAFLAAGASATVTSLWRVADRPSAEFMKQFYYFLSRGQSKAEALRSAKLRFWQSGGRWAAPRYWAAFVLNGDGGHCARVLRWSWLFGIAGLTALAIGMFPRVRQLRRRPTADLKL